MKKILTAAIFIVASHQVFAQNNIFPTPGETGIGTVGVYGAPLTPLHILTSPTWLSNNPTIRLESVNGEKAHCIIPGITGISPLPVRGIL